MGNGLEKLDSKSSKGDDYKSTIQIIKNLIQTLLSLVLLTYYRDFFFSLASFILELSFIIHKDLNINLKVTKAIIIFLSIILLSTLVIVIKHGRKALGFEEVKEITMGVKNEDMLDEGEIEEKFEE